MRFTSANEQNVFNIEHTFDWKEMVDLKTRTETNYTRISKKYRMKLHPVPLQKEDLSSFLQYHKNN